MFLQNLKYVALPVPEIIGVPKKLGSPWICPRSIFSKILMGFYLDWHCKCTRHLKSVALPVPKIRGGSQVANPQSRGRRGHKGSGMVKSERALVPIGPPYIIFLLSALVCPKF